MGKLLKDTWKAGGKRWKALADYLNLVSILLNNIMIDGRPAEITRKGINLKSAAKSEEFTGVYFFNSVKYTLSLANRKAYWYHDASDNTSHWSDGPMFNKWDNNLYWRKTDECRAVEYILC